MKILIFEKTADVQSEFFFFGKKLVIYRLKKKKEKIEIKISIVQVHNNDVLNKCLKF